jgi:hypothetical protein
VEAEVRVVIAGSRTWTHEAQVMGVVRRLALNHPTATVVTGGARGVDQLAERVALGSGLLVSTHPAKWERYGKRAGFLRNEEMVLGADHVIAFWDGLSPGTKLTIDLALRYSRDLEVYFP